MLLKNYTKFALLALLVCLAFLSSSPTQTPSSGTFTMDLELGSEHGEVL